MVDSSTLEVVEVEDIHQDMAVEAEDSLDVDILEEEAADSQVADILVEEAADSQDSEGRLAGCT